MRTILAVSHSNRTLSLAMKDSIAMTQVGAAVGSSKLVFRLVSGFLLDFLLL